MDYESPQKINNIYIKDKTSRVKDVVTDLYPVWGGFKAGIDGGTVSLWNGF